MIEDFRVMLAGKAPADLNNLNYPVLVSPKLDGVRCIIHNGRAVSRNGLEIPCPTVQALFGDPCFNGLDGELIVGDPCRAEAFRDTMSFVMSGAHLVGQALDQLVFHVFDDLGHWDYSFRSRLETVHKRIRKHAKHFRPVAHYEVKCRQALEFYDEEHVTAGYEGTMIRDPDMLYKFGRSTTREGGLLKLKRFEDAEAEIIGFKELQLNLNIERTGGVANRRSSKKEGKMDAGTLGALIVRGVNGKFKDVTFDVGSGFTESERQWFWLSRHALCGDDRRSYIKYRFFPGGSKDKPRFPTYQGMRDPRDM